MVVISASSISFNPASGVLSATVKGSGSGQVVTSFSLGDITVNRAVGMATVAVQCTGSGPFTVKPHIVIGQDNEVPVAESFAPGQFGSTGRANMTGSSNFSFKSAQTGPMQLGIALTDLPPCTFEVTVVVDLSSAV